MDFSGSTGPHHTEMATVGIIFDFHQSYLNDLSYLGTVSVLLVSTSKSFSYCGFMALLLANSARPNSYSAFIWEKPATEMCLRTCISEGSGK